MRVPSFTVRDQRSIKLAACENVPPVMVVAGPNGAGKSTLLHAIRQQFSNVMYVGPHRAMRRQQVQQRHLHNNSISFETIMMSLSVPSYEGIRVFEGNRDAWGYDDSANYLKHALCQIEVNRSEAVTARYDRDGQITPGSLTDPWKPLKDLTHNLLPHLAFSSIDTTNRDQVRCLWHVHSKGTLVDIDELSSGEKSIIQMFYPLIERDIKARLLEIRQASPAAASEDASDPCVVIDEPELHLHPNLQLKVLDYLRVLTSDKNAQVIIATHSPTMVEYASFEELFLLRPVELVREGENQLVRIASDDERLRFLREVFGTTSNLTAMQPLIIVEGVKEKDAKVMPDRKLYRALHPGFDSVTIIPGGGKGECKALLESLNSTLPSFSPNLTAVALLDRDSSVRASEEGVHLLPVAMIENLLIDPDAIWEAIQSVVDRTSFATVDDVSAALGRLLDELEPDEVGRRAIVSLGLSYFRPKQPLEEIPRQASEHASKVLERYSQPQVDAAISTAKTEVAGLRDEHRRREEFHGKTTLFEFYKRHLSQTGLAKVVFTFETARHARRRRSVVKFFDEFFEKLKPPSI